MKLNIGKCFSFFIKEITLWKKNLVNSNANFLFLECSGFIFIKKPIFIIYFDLSYVFFLQRTLTLHLKMRQNILYSLLHEIISQ